GRAGAVVRGAGRVADDRCAVARGDRRTIADATEQPAITEEQATVAARCAGAKIGRAACRERATRATDDRDTVARTEGRAAEDTTGHATDAGRRTGARSRAGGIAGVGSTGSVANDRGAVAGSDGRTIADATEQSAITEEQATVAARCAGA